MIRDDTWLVIFVLHVAVLLHLVCSVCILYNKSTLLPILLYDDKNDLDTQLFQDKRLFKFLKQLFFMLLSYLILQDWSYFHIQIIYHYNDISNNK